MRLSSKEVYKIMYGQLLQEIRELRQRVEELEKQVYPKGQLKKKGIPKHSEIKPPWEREGLSKQEWKNKKVKTQ
jgi:cell division septum initiation protein DivIVA